jgi:circadian clock protein KaiB
MFEFEQKTGSAAQGKVQINSEGGMKAQHCLRLFVAGNTIRTTKAILSLRSLLEKYLPGRYQLEVIDIFQQPDLARQEQIIATPTLIKYEPVPKRVFVGDFTRTDVILSRLGVSGQQG